MKKNLSFLAAFALLLCLGACTGRPQTSPGPELTPAAAVTATPAPAPEAPPSSTPESAPTPTPEPTPSPTPEPAPSPTQEPEDPTEPLLGKMKRENAESVRYELGSWGETYLLRKGEEGFEEALDILFSLRGVRCEKPEALVSRSFDLGRQVELAYDGEYVYGGSYNGHHWLRLEGEGRPDQALSAIFERCAPALSGVGGLAPSHENLIRDDTLVLRTSSPVYDLKTLTAAIRGMHEAYKESGNRAVDELSEIYLIRENRTEETIYIDTPVLEMLVDGEWHYRHFRSSASFLMYGQAEPGETVLNIPMWRLAGELEPGQYRICVTYFLGGGEAISPDHVAYAEFEIAEDGPETPIPPLPWLEEALEAYEKAEEAYCWFTIHSIPNDLFVDREKSDGGFFYLITDPRFATWETLENYLLSLFDRATVERLLPGAYKEFDGRVYGADADAGGLWYVGERTGIRAWREMNGNVYVAVSYEYLPDGWTSAGEFTCTYPYVWEGDHRVFRDFTLPYVDGIPADFEED